MGIKNGEDACQKLMAPSLCPVMYKFLIFANPLNEAGFGGVPSFVFASKGNRGGMFLENMR